MKPRPPRGGFLAGFVVGLLIGLGVALAVALYITKAPVPFVNKLPQRTAEQDAAEAQRNRNWDPNAALGGKPVPKPSPAATSPSAAAPEPVPATAASAPPTATAPTPATHGPAPAVSHPARDPAAILAGQVPAASTAVPAQSFDYWVQVGAYNRAEDAETLRARLGLLGQTAKVLEREQAGHTVYRVRIGPFETRDDAEAMQTRLTAAGFESNLVRVTR